MKAIAFALVFALTVAPVVLAEETFNPYTGEWEEVPEADEVIQDPYADRPLYKDPDMETSYDPYRDRLDLEESQDDPWSDAPMDEWDKPQEEDEWSDTQEDEWDQVDPSMAPEEGYSDGYGDEGFQEQPQEESWSYSPETRERRGPPPPLRIPSNRR